MIPISEKNKFNKPKIYIQLSEKKLKKLVSVFSLVISIHLSAQQLTYKDERVDTLKITSNVSGFHFDTNGTTTGTRDEYCIVFNKESDNYVLNHYKRIKYKYTNKPETLSNKERIIAHGAVIDKNLISNLLKQFETNYDKPALNNIGVSDEVFLKSVSDKHIVQVAKRHKSNWYFKRYYSTKEESAIIFNGCQNTDTLNLFLATAFDTIGYSMITDYDDHFNVFISTAERKYSFEGKYPNLFKRPWYHIPNIGDFLWVPVLNLSINSALVKILPTDFSRLETLKFETLADKYIEWYLKRRKIIY